MNILEKIVNQMDPALQTMINNMPEKTGKTLEEWQVILKAQDFNKHSEAVNFLKEHYQVTHGFANTIVHLSREDKPEGQDLVKTQYNGKETLIPIYEALLKTMLSFGDDVIITPKKTTVSIIRKKQFALIKPATKTRVDLGLKLKDVPVGPRLEGSGPFGSMCTHRVQITDVSQIDSELTDWLKHAYSTAI